MNPPVKSPNDIAAAAKLFCGFGDRTRLVIRLLLAGGEHRVTDIVEALDASRPNVSGHLRCLKHCGLVIDRRAGREAFYRIVHPDLCPNYEPTST